MKKRFTEEQVVRILREAENTGIQIRELCRRHNITETTFFRWRRKYGGMDVPDARRLKDLEGENAKLKRLVAEQLLVIEGLKEFAGKKAGGLPAPGFQSPSSELPSAAAGQGPRAGYETDRYVAAISAFRISTCGSMAGRGAIPGAPPLERLGTASAQAAPAPQAMWHRHAAAWRAASEFGLEL